MTKGINYWKGKNLILSYNVYYPYADKVRLSLYDGVGTSYSSYHKGNSTWQRLEVTRIIDSNATTLRVKLKGIDITSAYCNAMLKEIENG